MVGAAPCDSVRASVLIVHKVPVYRFGLASGLKDAGFEVNAVASPLAIDGLAWDACLLQFEMVDGPSSVSTLRYTQPGAPIIVLVSDLSVSNYRLALGLGADGATAHDAGLPEIIGSVRTALEGRASLPIGIAHALAEQVSVVPSELHPQERAVSYLRALSRGESVASIARASGYSERQMYRIMRQIYGRIGAHNREHAIVLATRWGLIPAE